jgi:hypothetical protein
MSRRVLTPHTAPFGAAPRRLRARARLKPLQGPERLPGNRCRPSLGRKSVSFGMPPRPAQSRALSSPWSPSRRPRRQPQRGKKKSCTTLDADPPQAPQSPTHPSSRINWAGSQSQVPLVLRIPPQRQMLRSPTGRSSKGGSLLLFARWLPAGRSLAWTPYTPCGPPTGRQGSAEETMGFHWGTRTAQGLCWSLTSDCRMQ